MSEKMITKVLSFEVKEVAPRTLEFVGSTEDKDRQGDIIMASGWQLKHYKKNPVFMWAHNYDDPPVGKTKEVWIEDNKLKFHVEFADRETYEFADTIYKLYKGGFLRATSVGFLPIKSEPIEVKDDDEMFFHPPTRYLKQELLELSGCPVPANPNALAEAKAKGLIKDLTKFVVEAQHAYEKPYPNEHACRLRNPDDFQDGSFRRTEREHEGKKYSVIMGRLEGETTLTEQAYRYDKKVWTAAQAKSHCKDHDGTFEAASGGEANSHVDVKNINVTLSANLLDEETYTCECIECGYKMETDKHCADIKCPKCGGDMRRAERPGLGDRTVNQNTEETVEEAEEETEIHAKEAKEVSQAAIADEIDYLAKAIEDSGLNDENKLAAWELIRWILRLPGDDIPVDIAEKIGAVLNKTNRERLEKIKEYAQAVLDSAEKEDEPDKSISQEEAKNLIKEAITEAIDEARGKIRR